MRDLSAEERADFLNAGRQQRRDFLFNRLMETVNSSSRGMPQYDIVFVCRLVEKKQIEKYKRGRK